MQLPDDAKILKNWRAQVFGSPTLWVIVLLPKRRGWSHHSRKVLRSHRVIVTDSLDTWSPHLSRRRFTNGSAPVRLSSFCPPFHCLSFHWFVLWGKYDTVQLHLQEISAKRSGPRFALGQYGNPSPSYIFITSCRLAMRHGINTLKLRLNSPVPKSILYTSHRVCYSISELSPTNTAWWIGRGGLSTYCARSWMDSSVQCKFY